VCVCVCSVLHEGFTKSQRNASVIHRSNMELGKCECALNTTGLQQRLAVLSVWAPVVDTQIIFFQVEWHSQVKWREAKSNIIQHKGSGNIIRILTHDSDC